MALKILIAIAFFVVGACAVALYESRAVDYTRYCINGVWYLKFNFGVTAQISRNGTPELCKVVPDNFVGPVQSDAPGLQPEIEGSAPIGIPSNAASHAATVSPSPTTSSLPAMRGKSQNVTGSGKPAAIHQPTH